MSRAMYQHTMQSVAELGIPSGSEAVAPRSRGAVASVVSKVVVVGARDVDSVAMMVSVVRERDGIYYI